jgi:hypothetical protein
MLATALPATVLLLQGLPGLPRSNNYRDIRAVYPVLAPAAAPPHNSISISISSHTHGLLSASTQVLVLMPRSLSSANRPSFFVPSPSSLALFLPFTSKHATKNMYTDIYICMYVRMCVCGDG